MYQFEDNWEDEIAAISTQPEFQNITLSIIDPDAVVGGEYDVATGGYTAVTNDGAMYSGRARLTGIRWGVTREGSVVANANTITSFTVQLPQDASPTTGTRFKTGWTVKVTTAPKTPELLTRVFKITNDPLGSHSAARTLECALDADSVVAV